MKRHNEDVNNLARIYRAYAGDRNLQFGVGEFISTEDRFDRYIYDRVFKHVPHTKLPSIYGITIDVDGEYQYQIYFSSERFIRITSRSVCLPFVLKEVHDHIRRFLLSDECKEEAQGHLHNPNTLADTAKGDEVARHTH